MKQYNNKKKMMIMVLCVAIVLAGNMQASAMVTAELVESMDDYPTTAEPGYPHSGIWHEIESLAEQDRTLVYLYYIYGFSQKEISAILNIPTGTVKSRLYAARQKLKNCR